MRPNETDGTTDTVDPDQTAPLMPSAHNINFRLNG